MRRAMNLCLMGSTLVVCICWSMDLAAECIAVLHPGLRQRAAHLNELQTEIGSFSKHLDNIVDDLAQGHACLREASEALERHAVDHFPTYFAGLAAIEQEQPMRVKLARTLLRQLTMQSTDGTGASISRERLAQLNGEFEAIVKDERNAN